MSESGVESSVQMMDVDSVALAVALAVKFTVIGEVSYAEEVMEMQLATGGSQGCCWGEC